MSLFVPVEVSCNCFRLTDQFHLQVINIYWDAWIEEKHPFFKGLDCEGPITDRAVIKWRACITDELKNQKYFKRKYQYVGKGTPRQVSKSKEVFWGLQELEGTEKRIFAEKAGFKPGWTRTPPKAEIEGRYWEIVDRLSGKNKLRHRCTYPTGPDEPKCNYTARGIMNMKSHVNTVHIKKLICKFLFAEFDYFQWKIDSLIIFCLICRL